MAGYTGTDHTRYINTLCINAPSRKLNVIDGQPIGWNPTYYGAVTFTPNDGWPYPVHQKKANMVFHDGHVQTALQDAGTTCGLNIPDEYWNNTGFSGGFWR